MSRAALAAALILAAAPAWAGARAALEQMMLSRAQAAGGLDARQAQKLRDSLALYHADLDKLRDRFRAQMKELDAKVKAGAPDAQLNASLLELEKTYRAILSERARLVEDTRTYLTPVQRARIALDFAGKKLKRAP